MLFGPRSPPGENIHDWTDWSKDRIGVFEHNDSVNTMAISTPFARRWAKLKQRIGRIRGMPKTNDWVYESINDPYMATEIEEHLELEYPVIKWSKGEEYAVISNKSGKPLLDNKFDVKHPPKNIEFLKEFNNAQDALDYAEYRHTDEYGGSKFQNDRYYQNLENKFKEKRYTQKRGINRNPQGEEDFEHNV